MRTEQYRRHRVIQLILLKIRTAKLAGYFSRSCRNKLHQTACRRIGLYSWLVARFLANDREQKARIDSTQSRKFCKRFGIWRRIEKLEIVTRDEFDLIIGRDHFPLRLGKGDSLVSHIAAFVIYRQPVTKTVVCCCGFDNGRLAACVKFRCCFIEQP